MCFFFCFLDGFGEFGMVFVVVIVGGSALRLAAGSVGLLVCFGVVFPALCRRYGIYVHFSLLFFI